MKILLIDSEIEDIRELKKRIHWEAMRRGECGNGLQRKDGQGNGKKSETRPYRLLYGNR